MNFDTVLLVFAALAVLAYAQFHFDLAINDLKRRIKQLEEKLK